MTLAIVQSPNPTPPTLAIVTPRPTVVTEPLYGDLSGDITVHYRTGTSPDAHTETFTPDTMQIDLMPNYKQDLVAGAVRFMLGGATFLDAGGNGNIFTAFDPLTGSGTVAGDIDYASAQVNLTQWPEGQSSTVILQSLASILGRNAVSDVVFRIPSAPLRPGSVQVLADLVDGGSVSFFAPSTGLVAEMNCMGTVDVSTGLAHLRFGAWVAAAGHESDGWYSPANVRASDGKVWQPYLIWADSLRVTGTAYTYLPSSEDRIGVKPTRMPPDGRVLKVQAGDVVVFHHEDSLVLPTPITPGSTHSAGRIRLARARVEDAAGTIVPAGASTFEASLEAGTITFSASLNLSAFVQPFTFYHTIMADRVVSDVDISGRVRFSPPLQDGMPEGAYLSSAAEMGDLQARVDMNKLFTQTTWNAASPVWSDTRVGSEPALQFDSLNYQIAVTNAGAITERWALYFVTPTTFHCVGENLGRITTTPASINADYAPVNPATQTDENPGGYPYFVVPAGSLNGPSEGNALRFNTLAAKKKVWALMTVLPGDATVTTADFSIDIIGDTE